MIRYRRRLKIFENFLFNKRQTKSRMEVREKFDHIQKFLNLSFHSSSS